MSEPTQEFKLQYKVAGLSDDDTCECCGRTNLKRVVVLEVFIEGQSLHEFVKFGTTCAAWAVKGVKMTQAASLRWAQDEVRQEEERKLAERQALRKAWTAAHGKQVALLGNHQMVWVAKAFEGVATFADVMAFRKTCPF